MPYIPWTSLNVSISRKEERSGSKRRGKKRGKKGEGTGEGERKQGGREGGREERRQAGGEGKKTWLWVSFLLKYSFTSCSGTKIPTAAVSTAQSVICRLLCFRSPMVLLGLPVFQSSNQWDPAQEMSVPQGMSVPCRCLFPFQQLELCITQFLNH